VQASVQDVVKAREDRQRTIFEAETYRNQLLPNARGSAARETQNAEAYRAEVLANAEGESQRFTAILREYTEAPAVTRQRIYLETLEAILSSSTKVLLDTPGGNNLMYLPLDQLIQQRRNTNPGQTLPNSSSLPSTVTPSVGSASSSTERNRR
jgi:modulator of FtsH protease HflK